MSVIGWIRPRIHLVRGIPDAWDFISTEVIPRLLAERGPHDPVRVWSAGCASGQEAYTLAMVLAEALGPEAFRQRVKIYATDVDEEALTEARTRLTRPEPSRVCRDTLMYLNPETQRNMLGRLHFALGPQGTLFLGHAEMLLSHSERFTPLNLKDPIFRKAIGSHTGVERYNPTAACPTHLPMPAEPPSQLPDEALSSPLLKCPPVGRLRHRQSDLFRNACSGKQTKSSRLRV